MSLWSHLPQEVRNALEGFSLTLVLAFLGRLIWHVERVQSGDRRFWSIHLVWETFMAVGIGFAGDGIAAHFGLHGKPAFAAIIIIAYLGPRGIENVLARIGWLKAKGK